MLYISSHLVYKSFLSVGPQTNVIALWLLAHK
jgi:hypothetical protein